MMKRNHAWILSHPPIVLPRWMWWSEAKAGARVRYGRSVEINGGAVMENNKPAGVCMVATGHDGAKTVLTRFARSMV